MNKFNQPKKSLSEVNESVKTDYGNSRWKRLFAFLGPAYLVSVGYMDPGNWATDIAGGSKYGYSLIWILVMSNLIAILLQSHCARLGIVSGKDLAQASRETYPPFINCVLYTLAEIAIAACDLAEVIGMAIGINLLFGLPLIYGVIITVLDTFLLLFLLNIGIRKVEAFILALVVIIGLCFAVEMFLVKPDLLEVAGGLKPSIANEEALLIAIGIIGATVMPHNLYLHSSLVQTRKFERNKKEIKRAIKFNNIDSVVALNMALFVNAAILILSAASFNKSGMTHVESIQDAHHLLTPLLGTGLASVLFAVALIAAGQSSTITGTLAGQIIMEGYLNLRLQPWVRRILTRAIAIVPAVLSIVILGEESVNQLLILSQVVLSLQLGFAIIPLIHFVSNKKKMGEHAIKAPIKVLSWLAVLIIVGLNIKLVYEQTGMFIARSTNPEFIRWLVIPIAAFFLYVLCYITLKPIFTKKSFFRKYASHIAFQDLELKNPEPYKRISVTVDFGIMDKLSINHALKLGGKNCHYIIIHVVETPNALIYGHQSADIESTEDNEKLQKYALQLKDEGYSITYELGHGIPKNVIPELVKQNGSDLLVMGAHGHKAFKDLLFGSTIDAVRHRLNIPLMVVNTNYLMKN